MMKTTSLPSCLLTQHTAQSFHFQRQKDMLLQSSSFASPFHAATAATAATAAAATTTIIKNYLKDLNPTSALLSKSLFPDLGIGLCLGRRKSPNTKLTSTATRVQSSLLEAPVLWAGRVCIFYALLKSGLAGSPSNPLVADLETGSEDLGFSKWIEELQSKPEKEATDKRKFVSKWHSTTKGTLRRNYRIPSKTEGRHLLRSIASLLSDDDQFRDATSHKGCQIRRESAHGESVCCNNVRALFDELPTPHVVVEITPFPAGPLGEKDYAKAVKLEKVLRSGPSV